MTPPPAIGRLVRAVADRVSPPEPRSRDLTGRRRRITFLIVSAYATGGVPRAMFSVANELAARGHEVEVVSVYRTHPEPYTPVHPDVVLSHLEDRVDPDNPGENVPRARRNPARSAADRRLDRLPSELADETYPVFSGLTDELLRRKLSSLPPGIVVATRPELAVAAARWTHDDVITVDQEHLSFRARPEKIRRAVVDTGGRLDALVALTDADRQAWARHLGATSTTVEVIPNASEFTVAEPAPLTSRTVVAAGRLHHQKAFDRLIDAFDPVARDHPDWQLHIYGTGRKEQELRDQVERLGLGDQVHLMGFTNDFEARLEEAAIYALSSRHESFSMVLLESFSKGVPPVSFDCPEGPRLLIQDGVNGLLVPKADVAALSDGIRRLVEDEDLRRRLGAGALESARRYQVGTVTDRWESLFDELVAQRSPEPAADERRTTGQRSL